MALGLIHDDSDNFLASSSSMPDDSSMLELPSGNSGQDKLEPVAVIGFSLKFPQDATSPDLFWRLLDEKRCAMTEWPSDRINLDAFYHPDNNRNDTAVIAFSFLVNFARDHIANFQ